MEITSSGISARSAPLARAAAALQHQLQSSDSALAHPAWVSAREQVLAARAAGARLVVLVGERGAGKTRMLHDLAAALRADGNRTQLWRPLRADIDPAFHGVAFVDDAERLDLTLFEEIRGAQNYSAILAGNWPLDWLGAVAASLPVVVLPPLRRRELRRLLAASVGRARLPAGSIAPRVIDNLHAWSGGSARQATALAAASLASAAVAGTDRLTVQQVDQIAIELGLERRLPPPERTTAMARLVPAGLGVLAATLIVAVGVEAYRHGSISRSAARAPQPLVAGEPTASQDLVPKPTATTQVSPDATFPGTGTAAPTVIPASKPDESPIADGPPAPTDALAAPNVEPRTLRPDTVDNAAPSGSGESAAAIPDRPPAEAEPPAGSIAAVETAPSVDPAIAPIPEQAIDDPMRVAALPRDPVVTPRSTPEQPPVAGGTAGIIVRPELSSATTRVAVSYGDGDPAAARTARVLAQTLRIAGYQVEDPVAVRGRTASPGIHYYFAEDADAASRLAREVAAVTADATTQRSPARQPWPRPGTVEVVVPAQAGTPH